MVFLIYLILGAVAGTLAGLFGIGGGLIIVPALILSFDLLGVSTLVATHLAVGTSLATIAFTSLSSMLSHHRKQAVIWAVFRPLALGLAGGSVIGVLTASMLSGPALRLFIGSFAVGIGLQMALAWQPKPSRSLAGYPAIVGVGGFIGWGSAIFGIGGGAMTVPYLHWHNIPMQQAVGTSAACGFPIALMGASANIAEGWQLTELPPQSIGFVYLPALAGIVITSIPFARVGAKLAHQVSGDMLKRCFSVLLLVVGGHFIIQSLEML